ncbi:MAG TPA: S1C family serine protease, partial [Dehalococcoidia bacterium]|nr:S1C family serine protease [Dehalococcoidia bacterium]
VGDKAVATVEQLREALGGAQPGSTINIKVRRGTQEPTLQVSIPERQPKPRHFGILPRFPRGLVPELEGLGPREMLDHLQKLQFQLTDKDNKPLTIDVVVGKLQSISGGTGAAVAVEGKGSFSLASDAVLIRQGQKVEASAFQAGDPVSVMIVNGQARLVVSPPHLGGHAAAPRKGPFHMMGKDGGAGPRFGPGPRLMPQ